MKAILLCSDLDGTLIPNGDATESLQARKLFFQLAARGDIHLAYVSGRDEQLVKVAIEEYGLPLPRFVIGDVGTTFYRLHGRQWQLDEEWQHEIAQDWHGSEHSDVVRLLSELCGLKLRLQEESKQNTYKVSYYTEYQFDIQAARKRMSDLLVEHGIFSSLIWSRDEAEHCGLLDILPQRANKLQAIRFLMEKEKFSETTTVFAGDSGNDLDALTSGLAAILVKNSADDVQRTARRQLDEKGLTGCLHIARGDLHGLNGNYAAGVLEGLVHFFPETEEWLLQAIRRIADSD